MGVEIERKFLVCGFEWRRHAKSKSIVQGYIVNNNRIEIRIRTINGEAYLTLKQKTKGAKRREIEIPVDVIKAEEMLRSFSEQNIIVKTRYSVKHKGRRWEIDEFKNENAGLILAEAELASEDETLALPSWVGAEVTSDDKYRNSSLVKVPYSKW
jgi:adenylate cyclase